MTDKTNPLGIRAELKFLFSPDVDPLSEFRPNGPFGILVQAMVRPEGTDGEESFDFMLCTPEWLQENLREEFTLGRHFLFVREFHYQRLVNFVRQLCSSAGGATWTEVAEKLGRLGKWEFEDYVPSR